MENFITKVKTAYHNPDFQNQLWTMVSLFIAAGFTSVLNLIVTRQIGIALAGFLMYAFAISDLPAVLTIFGVRAFQNVDINQETAFSAYLGQRTLCALLASVGYIIFLLASDLDSYQFLVALLIYLFTLATTYADVFQGDLQQKGKMRIAGKMRSYSLLLSLIAAVTVLLITESLVLMALIAFIVVVIVNIIWIWRNKKLFGAIRVKIDFSAVKKLTLMALPIVISDFVSTFIMNAQKFYLREFLSDAVVGIYGLLMFPVTLIFLISAGFFQGAIATKTAHILANENIKHFKKRVNMQLLLSLCLFIPVLIGVYLIGVEILSWVYNTDLLPYRIQLTYITLGAALRAPVFVLGPVLIMFRKQKLVFIGTLIVAAISGPLMFFLVQNFGLYGAAFANIVIFVPQTIIWYIIYRIALRGREKL